MIDGQKVIGRQLVDPVDDQPLAAARLEHHPGHRSAVRPQPGGRQIAMQFGRDGVHGHAVVRHLLTGGARNGRLAHRARYHTSRQRIDKAGQAVRVQIRYDGHRRLRHGVRERPGSHRARGGERRTLEESAASGQVLNLLPSSNERNSIPSRRDRSARLNRVPVQ